MTDTERDSEPSAEIRLLREIRDVQREHLDEYRRVTNESLATQRRALVVQENAARVYRIATIVGGVLILFILGLIGYVMTFLRARGR